MPKFFIAAAIIIASLKTQAQKISGTVKDEAGKPTSAATVTLLRSKDSSAIKYAITTNEGNYVFANVKDGQYLISVSHTGYSPLRTGVIELSGGEVTIPAVTLKKNASSLATVSVIAVRPIVEVRADKTILNVEGTINAVGNDVLELLRKSPGVMVDKDDNLTLAGKNGIQIFIDGKPSPLSGTDLTAYLKSIQSSQIESIELITNPSAKYEAAGNAGIINIKFKKNKNLGTNGSVNAGYNIGTYAKYNGGISLNNRNAKTNIFGSYNYSRALSQKSLVFDRTQADSAFYQTNTVKDYNNGGHNFKTGADYFLNAKSTVGILINGNIAENVLQTAGPMNIFYTPTNTLARILYATGDNKNERKNVNFNLNYRYAVPKGKEFNIDADYSFFNIRGNQFQPNNYYDAVTKLLLYSNVYRMISPTDIDIYSFKTDYEQNFRKGQLGIGGKVGYISTVNKFNRYNVYGSTDVYDKDRSNDFNYTENINALYVNYNRSFKGWMMQLGVRGENTISKGQSTGLKYSPLTFQYNGYDSLTNKTYFDLFPSAAVTFNKNPMSQFGISFSSRIDRPAYQDLNPFELKINDYTFMKGNTQLRPQYTKSLGFTHTYKYKLTSQLNFSHVKDIFTLLPDTTEKSKSFITKKNLATQDIVALNITYLFSKKWYSFFTSVNSYYSKYTANFGGGDRNINLQVIAFTVFLQNSFKLGKGFTGELSGFYNSPSIWQGFFRSKAMYSVDAGLQKSILKGKGNIKSTVSDVFNIFKIRGSSSFSGQSGKAFIKPESRQFKINFTYRFGNNKVKAARQRKDGAEEERKRSQSNDGMGQ